MSQGSLLYLLEPLLSSPATVDAGPAIHKFGRRARRGHVEANAESARPLRSRVRLSTVDV